MCLGLVGLVSSVIKVVDMVVSRPFSIIICDIQRYFENSTSVERLSFVVVRGDFFVESMSISCLGSTDADMWDWNVCWCLIASLIRRTWNDEDIAESDRRRSRRARWESQSADERKRVRIHRGIHNAGGHLC